MGEGRDEIEFIEELRRVLGFDPAGTEFFAFRTLPPVDVLRRVVEWFRRQPAGLGEAQLQRRIREEFGPPPDE